MRVIPVPQLLDNYAYVIVDEETREAAVVDCAEALEVRRAVEQAGAKLVAILPTHHHFDHVGGNLDLLADGPLRVYGLAGEAHRIPGCTDEVRDGDTIRFGQLEAQALHIPAHTAGHLAWYFAASRAVFTGDTLFAGGCGRLFEGDAAMMMASLARLTALPDDTAVWFGHEYTEKNLRFALTLEPGNADLQRKHTWAREQRAAYEGTMPTTILSEKQTNPFLRTSSPELRATLQARFPELPMEDVAIFARIRALKDEF